MFEVKPSGIPSPAFPPTSCVTSSSLLNHSLPLFLPLNHVDNMSTDIIGLFEGSVEQYMENLAKCLHK